MLSLVVIGFFALTGITLNHPDWLFGGHEVRREVSGTIAKETFANGKVDWLKLVEQLRADQNLRGRVEDMRSTDTEGSLAFKAPAYIAEGSFDVRSGKYQLTITTSGFIATLNDLHRGQSAGRIWGLLIDLAGASLAILSLTGLGFMFFLKKIRLSALLVAAAGLIALVLIVRTTS